MIVRELLAKFGLHIDQTNFKKADSAVSGLKSAAGSLVAVFASGAIAAGFHHIIGLASDSNENLNVLNASFGKHMQTVLDWSEVVGKEVGRSKYDLQAYAAGIGSIAKPMLEDEKAALEMSTTLAQLSVDLGSFFNTTDEQALQALKSGLTGQSEPLRRYGVVLLDTTLKAFAHAQGITKSWEAMTIAEKTMLRYQYIMKVTKAAQGDAAKTANGYANASKALSGALKELLTDIARKILPAVEKFVIGAKDLIYKFKNLTKETNILAVALWGLSSALAFAGFIGGVYLITQLGQLANLGVKLSGVFQGVGNASLGALIKAGIMGADFIALAVIILLLVDEIYTALTGGQTLFGMLTEKFREFILAPISPKDHWFVQLLQYLGQLTDWLEDKMATLAYNILQQIDKIKNPIDLLKTAWNLPIIIWQQTIGRFFKWLAAIMKDIPLLGKLAAWNSKIRGDFTEGLRFDTGLHEGLFTANNVVKAVGSTLFDFGQALQVAKSAYGVSNNVSQSNNVKIEVYQQPGESGEQFAKRVGQIVEEKNAIMLSHAQAGLTPSHDTGQ